MSNLWPFQPVPPIFRSAGITSIIMNNNTVLLKPFLVLSSRLRLWVQCVWFPLLVVKPHKTDKKNESTKKLCTNPCVGVQWPQLPGRAREGGGATVRCLIPATLRQLGGHNPCRQTNMQTPAGGPVERERGTDRRMNMVKKGTYGQMDGKQNESGPESRGDT